MSTPSSIETILQKIRDDSAFRQLFVEDPNAALAQERSLSDVDRAALRSLDVPAFLNACASVTARHIVVPVL